MSLVLFNKFYEEKKKSLDTNTHWFVAVEKEDYFETKNEESNYSNRYFYLMKMSENTTKDLNEETAVFRFEIVDPSGWCVRREYTIITKDLRIGFSINKTEQTGQFSIKNPELKNIGNLFQRREKIVNIFQKNLAEINELRLLFVTGVITV